MKPLLLPLFLLAAIAANAQKNESGLNVGAICNVSAATGKAGYFFSVKQVRNIGRHLQAGLAVGASKLHYYNEGFTPMPSVGDELDMISSCPFYMATVLVNYRKELRNIAVYGGVSAGYAGAIPYREKLMRINQPLGGITYGGQVGMTLFLRKQLGLNAELAPSFVPIYSAPLYIDGRYVTKSADLFISLSVGVRYKF